MMVVDKQRKGFVLRVDEVELLAGYRRLLPQGRVALREVVNDRVQESGTRQGASRTVETPRDKPT